MRLKLPLTAAMCLALWACGSEQSGTVEIADGETAEYTVDSDGDTMNATVTTAEGTATMQSGENARVALPDGYTVYPGARVVSVTNVDAADTKGALVMMETSDSPDKVAAFYRKQAEAAGVAIEMEMAVNGGKMLGGQGPDERVFSLNTTSNGDNTAIQLTVGKGRVGS